MNPMPRRWFALLVGLCLALAACAGPLGTARVDPKIVLGNLGRSAVATGEPSMPTRNVLFEQGLFVAFDERPEAAIADAAPGDGRVAGGPRTCCSRWPSCRSCTAMPPRSRTTRLAAAVYAYAFLFPENAGGGCPGAVRPARSHRGGSVQLGAHQGVHVEGQA